MLDRQTVFGEPSCDIGDRCLFEMLREWRAYFGASFFIIIMSSDFIRIAIDSTGLPEEMSTVMVNAIKSFGIFSLKNLS